MRPIDAFLLKSRLLSIEALSRPFNACAKLYWDDPQAFIVERHVAGQTWSLEPFISLALTQHAFGRLKTSLGYKLARRLCGAGRHAEALDVFRDYQPAESENPDFLLLLADILTGMGRTDDAADAARKAVALNPAALDAQALSARLEDAARLKAEASVSSRWSPINQYLQWLLDAGAFHEARTWLQRRLAAGLSLDRGALGDVHAILNSLLLLLEGDNAYGLFRALGPYYPATDCAADLKRIEAGLLDPADEPPPGEWVSAATDLHLSGAMAWGAIGKTKTAIDALGALSLVRPTDFYVRACIARLIERELLSAHPIEFQPSGTRKIFDIFPFNDEFDLLDIKLGVMGDWVDHFVLVEARETFTGLPKPLNFQANQARYAAFKDKIVHVVIDRFPDHINSPWARDFYQRDMAIKGLSGLCAEEDLVLFTDTDEIIVEEAVRSFEGEHAHLMQERSRFFLNYREVLSQKEQRGAVSVWRAKYLRCVSPSNARFLFTQNKKAPVIYDAGWHFTGVRDVQGILNKMRNTAHQEWEAPGEDEISAKLEAIRQGQTDPGWEKCELDERFPPYIHAARARLADLIL